MWVLLIPRQLDDQDAPIQERSEDAPEYQHEKNRSEGHSQDAPDCLEEASQGSVEITVHDGVILPPNPTVPDPSTRSRQRRPAHFPPNGWEPLGRRRRTSELDSARSE